MRTLRTALAAVAVGALTLLAAGPASAGDQPQTFTPPCDQSDVKCDGESSGDAPVGAWCSFDHDDDAATPALEGHVDHRGRCVCAVPPTTTSTSSTVPETTTSTVAPTTSSTVIAVPTTVVASPSTTVGQQPTSTVAATPSTQPLARPLPAARPVSSGQLPHTGSNTGPMVGVGAALVAAGSALVWVTRRRLAA